MEVLAVLGAIALIIALVFAAIYVIVPLAVIAGVALVVSEVTGMSFQTSFYVVLVGAVIAYIGWLLGN